MSKLLITIGGSGSRAATAAMYTMAAGLMEGHGNIDVMRVDKDTTNGTTATFDITLAGYNAFAQALGDDTDGRGLAKYNVARSPWTLESILSQGESDSLQRLYPDPSDVALLDLLYDSEEQSKPLTDGFERHPNIGALLFERIKEDPKFISAINNALQNAESGGIAEIFVIGSIFGGTGASMFSNIMAFIRDKAKKKGKGVNSKVVLGGMLLLPYFQVPRLSREEMSERRKRGEYIITDEDFIMASQKALGYYHSIDNLLRSASNRDDAIFDALYLAGYSPRCLTVRKGSVTYAKGGSRQKSDCTLIDLFAASAMCHFFDNADKADSAFNIADNDGHHNLFIAQLGLDDKLPLEHIGWENLPPATDTKLLQLLQFSLFVTVVFATDSGYYQSLIAERLEKTPVLDAAYTFCRGYLEFLLNVASSRTNEGMICSLLDTEQFEALLENLDKISATSGNRERKALLKKADACLAELADSKNGMTAPSGDSEIKHIVGFDAAELRQKLNTHFGGIGRRNRALKEADVLRQLYLFCADRKIR